MNNKGFSLPELVVSAVFAMIVLALGLPHYFVDKNNQTINMVNDQSVISSENVTIIAEEHRDLKSDLHRNREFQHGKH